MFVKLPKGSLATPFFLPESIFGNKKVHSKFTKCQHHWPNHSHFKRSPLPNFIWININKANCEKTEFYMNHKLTVQEWFRGQTNESACFEHNDCNYSFGSALSEKAMFRTIKSDSSMEETSMAYSSTTAAPHLGLHAMLKWARYPVWVADFEGHNVKDQSQLRWRRAAHFLIQKHIWQ